LWSGKLRSQQPKHEQAGLKNKLGGRGGRYKSHTLGDEKSKELPKGRGNVKGVTMAKGKSRGEKLYQQRGGKGGGFLKRGLSTARSMGKRGPLKTVIM